ncbi:MAG: helix-hairpin-helix domain-containing protein [Clostridiales bacterium]|nr:helix-hairpin-helix domain-containing protein [Clostridiales bacterium]
MKTRFSGILKWLALAVFLLAAGFFYSCGGSDPGETELARAQGQEEAASQEETVALGSQRASAGEDTKEETTSDGVAGEEAGSGVETAAAEEYAAAAQEQEIYVYVCGEVLCPGVYRMTDGQRIFEAIEMAGGFTEAAAASWLNLAEPVYDGMKLEAPTVSQTQDPAWITAYEAGAGQTAAGRSATSAGETSNTGFSKVNINTATKEQLMTLSGIGEVKAADIIRYREENGAFGRIEDIMNVPGIKDAAFQKIKESITV